MISFGKTSTISIPVYVKKPEALPLASEKPASNNNWYIPLLVIVLIIAIVIAIVVYFLLRKAGNKSRRKFR